MMVNVAVILSCIFLHAGAAEISWRQDNFSDGRNLKDNFGKNFPLNNEYLSLFFRKLECNQVFLGI